MEERQAYEAFRQNVRRLAAKKIAPFAAAYDREKRFPEESLAAFKELDLVQLAFD